jgi:hypothetical protein
MKKLFATLLFASVSLGLCATAIAQDKRSKDNITDVTLYPQGYTPMPKSLNILCS